MERKIDISPAWAKREKGCGIHGCEMRFVLMGKLGAVQFLVFTNWHLPEVQDELLDRPSDKSHVEEKFRIHALFSPMPADLGYHSPKPKYDGQESTSEKCPYLDGKPCYYDGSGLNAEPVYEILVREGSDGVWKRLEEYYVQVFGELK